MLTLKEQADVFRIGLITKLLSQRDVTAWADNIIETQDSPDSPIIDISLMGSADMSALVSVLFDVKGKADPENTIKAVLGLCADKLMLGSLALEEAVAVLDRLAPDMSCRRCNIRSEYALHIDPDITAAIRAALYENTVSKFLAPYAIYAADISFGRA